MSNINKIVHFCPVDGLVPKAEFHTHTYHLQVKGEHITLDITNKGYMIEGTEYYHYALTKAELRLACSKFKEQIIGGNAEDGIAALVDEMPDVFIETIAWVLGQTNPVKPTATPYKKPRRSKVTLKNHNYDGLVDEINDAIVSVWDDTMEYTEDGIHIETLWKILDKYIKRKDGFN